MTFVQKPSNSGTTTDRKGLLDSPNRKIKRTGQFIAIKPTKVGWEDWGKGKGTFIYLTREKGKPPGAKGKRKNRELMF